MSSNDLGPASVATEAQARGFDSAASGIKLKNSRSTNGAQAPDANKPKAINDAGGPEELNKPKAIKRRRGRSKMAELREAIREVLEKHHPMTVRQDPNRIQKHDRPPIGRHA
jgi:hypothetical protein